jgi:16S rRNA A1518/A1519 N6-dimethyltransferase RsmA/KsgA/DIM1 with predicted DNA glycosylase/AP lyase activity
VTSALLRLVPRRPRTFPSGDERALTAFLLAVFSRRRKVLSSAIRAAREDLSPEVAHALCEAAGLDPRVRPEDVPPEVLLGLWRRVAAA